ncbi:GtrA-like protein [Thalassovita gelatinovora]|uniref:GtrA-like protein n=1 Tax=Thalassovita gelatinovora TaxID=53501 RepID=A0A0N7LUZ3_THAGE|nr:GtrA family protein [Thalassovita gelatinovora]QIZ81128.1 GtrA family protein [Thalassovita gelatinovora]CUH64858.1 GtrA-like protein [Thalassovita gelatinovora]SEP90809.1 Putative flippase GtrA (transmembrane translocase of bactoprenol-linked glucose) [Thalassovita gelatinovora]
MFIKFLICSGLAAVVNLTTGYFLYGVMGFNGPLEYAGSVALAFVMGMAVSFVLNRAYTYDPSGRHPKEEVRDFFLVSVVGLGLTTLLAHLFLTGLRWVVAGQWGLPVAPETAAHIMAVGFTAFYSFFAHRHVSFRPANPDNYLL